MCDRPRRDMGRDMAAAQEGGSVRHRAWLCCGLVAGLLLHVPAAVAQPVRIGNQDAARMRFPRPDAEADRASGGDAGAYLIARVAMARGDVGLAARHFMAAFAHAATNPLVGRQALTACLLAERPEAEQIAAQIVTVEPGNPVARLVLADAEAGRGRYAAAAQHFAAIPREGLFALLQPPLLAWAQFGAGSADARRPAPGQREGGAGGALLLQQGLMADLAQRPMEAERLYRSAQGDLGAADFVLARALASVQERRGHHAEAMATLAAAGGFGLDLDLSAARLRAAVARRPVRSPADGIAGVYVAFAALARQQSGREVADLLLRLALRLSPDLTVARIVAADALDSAGRAAAALDLLAPVAPDDPLAPSVDLRRARLLARLGQTDFALTLLKALAQAAPERAEPWAAQSDILRAAGRPADAAAAATRAIALRQPGRWQDRLARGLAEEAAGQWPEAEADYRAARGMAPDEPAVLIRLALGWSERGAQPEAARELAGRAAAARPGDADIVAAAGLVALRTGDTQGAVRWLERATELLPTDLPGNEHLADAYWAAGRRLEARYQWRHALTLTDRAEDIARLRAKLAQAEAQD